MVKTIIGFVLYYFFPKKKIILIASTMRSGTTLLKALLAEAPDVSNLPETKFSRTTNKFLTYYHLYRLSPKRIIVLKQPSWFHDYENYPAFPTVPFKLLIIIRNPIDTLISVKVMHQNQNISKFSNDKYIDYWCKTYENLKDSYLGSLQKSLIVKYDSLIEEPEKNTMEIFSFIESKIDNGVTTYKKPDKYNWEWLKDDGGPVIKSLKVQKIRKDYSQDKAFYYNLAKSKRIASLLKFYGVKMPKIN